MLSLYSILYVDIFRQSSHKNTILLSMMHKQYTYFSKKYSKINRITLNKTNRLSKVCEKDNVKIFKYMNKIIDLTKYNRFAFKCAEYYCIKIIRYLLNNGYDIESFVTVGPKYGYICKLLYWCVKNKCVHFLQQLVFVYFCHLSSWT